MAKATKKQALGRGLSALLKDPNNDIKSVDDKNADKVMHMKKTLEGYAKGLRWFSKNNIDAYMKIK